eukprot:gene104-406_t
MADFGASGSRTRKVTRRVAQERRRLTLGVCDRPGKDELVERPTDNTGLINFLQGKHVTDMTKGSSKRKISFSSVTNDPGQEAFTEKPTTGDKTREELNRLGVGICCKKGLKPESPNQDSFSYVYVGDDFQLVGVYDGHGTAGHHVSHFVKDTLPKLFLSDPNRITDPAKALEEAFSRTQKLIETAEKNGKLQSSMSGTTCTVAYLPKPAGEKWVGQKIYLAHCGDSKSVLLSDDPKNASWKGAELTEDHKPSLPQEKKRIEENGGRVMFDGYYNHRVFAK